MDINNMENKNFYLFTGAPGSGKSSVLNILKNKGYLTVKEAARDIIRNQLKTKGDALPWGDTVRYSNLMLLHSIVEFEEYVHIKEPCFSDRGIIDVLVYARLINIPVTVEMKDAAKKYGYNKRIFLFPFWEEIYINDVERKQNLDEAKRTSLVLKDVYEEFGYQVIDVPLLSPQERTEWVLSCL